MANKKISQLTAKGTALDATDLVEISESDGAGGYVTKSVTGSNILDSKQDTLVSGTNLKTVNGTDLLASGDLVVQPTLSSGVNIKTINGTTILGSGDLSTGGGGGVHILTNPVSGRSYSVRTDCSSSSASSVSAANTIYLSPFVPANSLTISNLQINVTSAAVGASARILVYSDLNGVPTTKLIESTTLDCSTTGAKTYTTSYTFTAGTTYWLGVYTNNTSFFMSTISSANSIPISTNAFSTAYTSVTASATFGSAPSTLGTATLASGNMYVINLTAA
jgi:hypothetical protein